MLYTDSMAVTGWNHIKSGAPLQDRAMTSVFGPGRACVVVADGCSTGGDTGLGADILNHSAIAAVRKGANTRDGVLAQQRAAMRQAIDPEGMGLRLEDMLGTSLVLSVDESEGGWANIHGDGALYWKNHERRMFAIMVEWAKLTEQDSGSAPTYPVYSFSEYKEFLRRHRNRANPGPSCVVTCVEIDVDGSHNVLYSNTIPLEEAVHGFALPITLEELLHEIEFLGVVTDGYQLVENIEPTKVIAEMMAFKSLGPNFLQRRMRAFLKYAATVGNGPLDDFGASIIQIQNQD